MMTRNLVTFKASLPDDTVWDEGDLPVTPGGQSILEEVRSAVVDSGWPAGPISQHSFYGWAFWVDSDPRRMRVLIQYPDPWLLMVTRESSWLKRISGTLDHRVDRRLLEEIHRILSEDQRFSEILWYTYDDFGAARMELGADSPIESLEP